MAKIINEDTRMICVLLISVLVTFTNGHLPRQRRQVVCEHGVYPNPEKTALQCCMCSRGYSVKSHCIANGSRSECVMCSREEGTYTAEANSKTSCDKCLICNPRANLEVVHSCSITSDTVCGCQYGFFCEEDNCKVCQPCKSCENGEKVAVPCSKRNDTICKPEDKGGNLGGVIGAVVGVVLIAAVIAVMVGYLRRKKLYCFAKKNDGAPEPNEPKEVELEPLLQGVDLMPYVRDIAENLSFSDMAKVAGRIGMSEVKIQRHKSDNPLNEEEQVVSLLKAWIEEQGLEKASGTLIRTLRTCRLNEKANEIQQILMQGRTAEQPGNGAV